MKDVLRFGYLRAKNSLPIPFLLSQTVELVSQNIVGLNPGLSNVTSHQERQTSRLAPFSTNPTACSTEIGRAARPMAMARPQEVSVCSGGRAAEWNCWLGVHLGFFLDEAACRHPCHGGGARGQWRSVTPGRMRRSSSGNMT